MKCRHCGAEIADSAKFCPNCGQTQGVPEPNVTAQAPKKSSKIGLIVGALALVAVIGAVGYFALGHGGAGNQGIEYFVTGREESLKIFEQADSSSEVLGHLENGDSVSVIETPDGRFWKINVPDGSDEGYVDNHFLTTDSQAVCEPAVAYADVADDKKLAVKEEADADSDTLTTLQRGDEVTVLARPAGEYYFIRTVDGDIYGYVTSKSLSDDKIVKQDTTTATTAPATSQSSVVIGSGTAPSSSQGKYYVNVAKGYLALRNAKAFDASNEIGKMYNGDYVEAINNSGTYWYVYSPSLGMYGYTNSEYLVGTFGKVEWKQGSARMYYANVATGYLALRSARAYDASNEIAKINNGQEVIAIDSSTGQYWYVYVPAIGKYGYVNSDYLK